MRPNRHTNNPDTKTPKSEGQNTGTVYNKEIANLPSEGSPA